MDVDMSLDDMIASKNKSSRRGGRQSGGRGPRAPAAPATAPASNARDRYAHGAVPIAQAVQSRQAAAAVAIQAGPRSGSDDPTFKAVKIIISNLPLDVDDAAVKDLFQSTVGPTRECFLAYDRHGKHKGVATVVFSKQGDAQKAYKQYNNRLIDGRTPMKVEVVLSALPTPSLTSRVAPVVAAPVTYVPVAPVGQTGVAAPMTNGGNRAPRAPAARRSSGRVGGAAGSRQAGGRGERPPNRPKKTQEDLDAEMENWSSANAASTTA